MDDNHSWNCGVEGPSDDPQVLGLRRRQVRNLMATLLLSQGVPMFLAGDEFLRTQGGNNNAWCQDNEVSWVNWNLVSKNADFFRFVREMIALRKRHPVLRRRRFFRGAGPDANLRPDVIWHGVEPHQPDFSGFSRSLAYVLDGGQLDDHEPQPPDRDFYIACNAWSDVLSFRIPEAPSSRPWRRVVDTALASPLDIVGLDEGPLVPAESYYHVAPFSLIVLIAEARPGQVESPAAPLPPPPDGNTPGVFLG
jgi:glycogen operon protein